MGIQFIIHMTASLRKSLLNFVVRKHGMLCFTRTK
uniref:Uncharacterized protein n=1 Tax=Myoviridae sp. ctYA416 TaxID=2825125 RepID=A0A8S5UTN3_9CAUD|nr:MAG TPA: hypothetical protein [Myoviridae sp. ctYA416]